MQRHFLSTGLWGNLPKVEGSNNQGGEDKAKDFRSILRWNSWMTRGTKPQNEYLSDQMGGKSQNINIKELLEQHVEHGKNHYGFLNRDLIFHPQRVNGRTRYRLLLKRKEKENTERANNTAAASPESPASIREQPNKQSTGGTKEKAAFCQQLVPLRFPLSLSSFKTPASSCEILC